MIDLGRGKFPVDIHICKSCCGYLETDKLLVCAATDGIKGLWSWCSTPFTDPFAHTVILEKLPHQSTDPTKIAIPLTY